MTGRERRENDLTILGRTNWRDVVKPFGIRRADRRAHVYVVGKTGTGKSTLLETMLVQDLERDEGVALLDPHGDLALKIRDHALRLRPKDLLYLDPAERQPLGFNPLSEVPPERRSLAAAGLLDAMKKLWEDSWGPRLEHLLRNAFLALMEHPGATLADVLRLLEEEEFRKELAERIGNPVVKRFWATEFEAYPTRFRAEVISPVQNKVGAFLADPRLRRVLVEARPLSLRAVMDTGQVLVANLSKGMLGPDASGLLGALLTAAIGYTALGRADVAEDTRRDFYLYLDEFQTFATLSVAEMLSELRKYRVNLTIAHQYLGQLDTDLQRAVLGNAGTYVVFRVGAQDARVLAEEFEPEAAAAEILRLSNQHFCIRLMTLGETLAAFTGRTLRVPSA